jgi:N-acetylglucosamine-6-phosphate deacetylase
MPNPPASFAVSAPVLFDGQNRLEHHCAVIRDTRVAAVLPACQAPGDLPRVDLEAGILAPGLVDLQVNGGGGVLFNNAPTPETVDRICAAHRRFGTTTLLPTLLSDTPAVQRAAVEAVRTARARGNAMAAGIHLEGPFFAPGRRGAHSADHLRAPEAADIDWLCSIRDLPVLLTLAPEQVAADQIRRLADAGLRLCAGHTEATYEQLAAARVAGLQGVTHLFNAMSPLTARAPGAVGAALDDDGLWLGIIADGHHVHPACLRLAHRAKPPGKMILVSDAMATVGGESGSFELYGQTITVREGRLENAQGTLAGSAIALIEAVRFAVTGAGLPLEESLRMASLYPAAVLGLDRQLGRIAPGYRADMVHFTEDFTVRNVWVAGRRG